MSSSTRSTLDSVSNSALPFGLPLGSVRAFMALLILSNFWIVVVWPNSSARPLLGHFIMLPLVLYSFTLSRDPRPSGFVHRFLPFQLRILYVGGTVAAIFFVVSNGIDYRERLTPEYSEFRDYWMPFSAALGIGLLFGITVNAIFGPTGAFFQTVRAWLSVVSMVLLSVELGLFIIHLSSKTGDAGYVDFLRNYQLFEIGVVSAYFGTRI